MSNNQLEQSAGSKAMPKIKFNLKDYDDSDSDEEVKKLQMKYLKKR
ncbi:unnamed protein product [Paramecium octaurelia]|nr:unnamed protein product [Paramecium octaurelia]